MIVETSFKINAQTVLEGLSTGKMFSRIVIANNENGKIKKKEKIKIGDVWIESRNGEDMICGETGGDILRYPITPEAKRTWYKAKNDLTRLSLLARSSAGELQLHKDTCSNVVSIRVTEDEYRQLESDAGTCEMTLSEYCRQQLTNRHPHTALSQETRLAIDNIHRHLVNYGNALKGQYQHVPHDQRPGWIVEGLAWQQYRKYIAQTLKYLDKLINH